MSDFLKSLNYFLILAEQAFTYEKIFDLLGVTQLLSQMYIEPKDLDKSYINIFYKNIKNFINQPLYRDISLNNPLDLKFLKEDKMFQDMLVKTINKIKKELDSRTVRVMTFLKKYDSNKEISLEDIMKSVKLDKASLLFILDDLKNEGVIYDYNGREVTT